MAISEETYYTVKCDQCGTLYGDDDLPYYRWCQSPDTAVATAVEDNWRHYRLIAQRDLCPSCFDEQTQREEQEREDYYRLMGDPYKETGQDDDSPDDTRE